MNTQNKKISSGILFALLASVISGVAIFYSKMALIKIPPLVLTTSRNFYVGVLFFLLFIFSKRLGELKKIKKNQLVPLIIIGIVGGALPFYLFFSGLQYMSAISANLIQKTLFIWVALFSLVFLKEKLNRWYIVSFVLIFAANIYIANIKITLGLGEMMVLAATLLWSAETIIAKKVMSTISSELVGLFRMGIGGLILMTSTILSGKGNILLTLNLDKLSIIFIGGTILFLYVLTWYKALKYAPASLVTLILTFATVVGNILNGAFAGVKLFPKDVYSSILIVGATGIILIQYKVISNVVKNLAKRIHNI